MKVDCLFISNLLSESHIVLLSNFLGNSFQNFYFKPLFFKDVNNNNACLIALECTPYDFLNKIGSLKARRQFLQALKYAVENLDIKIVLLAASTKRLFGKECELRVNWSGLLDDAGFTLQELYPDLLFTNGDNGTSVILNLEIDSILKNSSDDLKSSDEYAIIINGLGLLGMDSLEFLLEKNLSDSQIIVISNYTKDLKEIIRDSHIQVFPHIQNISNCNNAQIRGIVCCTHNPSNILNYESIKHIQNGQAIHVIDVAVPYGFPEEEFLRCKNVFRQDGGNAYIEKGLEFFFNPEICGLTDNIVYGCFAEAMALSAFIKEQPENKEFLRGYDFFNVNRKTKEFVRGLFKKYGIGIAPVPYSYMKRM